MTIYKLYWELWNKLADYAKIRRDESCFIQTSLNMYDNNTENNFKILMDIGCGDGRLSHGLLEIKQFKKVILVDETESINLAKKRIEHLCDDIHCIQTKDPINTVEKEDPDILLCVGLINYFENQERAVKDLLSNNIPIVFVSVTSYNILGRIYKILNVFRGRLINEIAIYIMSKIILKYTEKIKKYNYLQKIFIYILKLIEPFISPKIYYLDKRKYESIFISNGYKIMQSKCCGLSHWYCLARS